ncbi:MAG: hypothetical protein GY753_09850 [Gammaproteobacteria bacterium]|nr:hypothetical protein [Gammaproteobacteria bacterium]
MYYILVKDNAIIKKSRRAYGFRSDDIAYPKQVWERYTEAELAALGAYPVSPVNEPDHDSEIDEATSDIQLVNGVPEQVWQTGARPIAQVKKNKIARIREVAIDKMAAVVPAINSEEMVDFLVALWPMLDTANAPAEILLVRDLYQYSKQKINWIRNTGTPAEIRAYKPAEDTGWPS